MFAFYLVGYVAVAAAYYFRAYHTAPLIEDSDAPLLTLWVNPDMEEGADPLRKAA